MKTPISTQESLFDLPTPRTQVAKNKGKYLEQQAVSGKIEVGKEGVTSTNLFLSHSIIGVSNMTEKIIPSSRNPVQLPKQATNLQGLRFGKLVVLSFAGRRPDAPAKHDFVWFCACDCGNTKVVRGVNLKLGNSTHCGCLRHENNSKARTKHGLAGTRVYRIWQKMKSRCYNPSNNRFYRYGRRGIKVCDRWLHSFNNFLADMGQPPSDKHSIDRKDADGDYTPSNCHWATDVEQMNNMSTNHLITLGNKTQSVSNWCQELDRNYSTVITRLRSPKWSDETSILTPTKTGFIPHTERERRRKSKTSGKGRKSVSGS